MPAHATTRPQSWGRYKHSGKLAAMAGPAPASRPTRRTSTASPRTRSDRRRRSTGGTPNVAGRILYERQLDLQGAGLAMECDRILRTSAKVAMVHNRLIDAACSAKLRWVPGSDSEAAQRNAKHMNSDFGLGEFQSGWLRRDFDDVRRRTIGFAGGGFAYAEVGIDCDADGIWHVTDIFDCCPTAHASNGWCTDADGDLDRILQASVYGQSGYIDARWALLWSFTRSANNFEGRGLLRPCVPWFKMVSLAYEMLGIATEKYAIGVPKGRISRGEKSRLYDADLDDMIDRLEELMKAFAAGESSFLLDSDEFQIEIAGTDAYNPEKIVSVLRFAFEQILSAYLLNMLELGTSGTGSYNVGQVLQDAFTQLVTRVLDTWCAAFSGRPRPGGGSVLRVLELSYGPQHPNDLPRLRHFGVADDPFADLVPHLPHLLNPQLRLAKLAPLFKRLMRLAGIEESEAEVMMAALNAEPAPDGPQLPTKDLDPSTGGVPRKAF